MPPKTERFELRLETDLIESVDQWRADQPGMPTRSKAIRQLVQTGIETNTTRQLFVAAKFQIITAALTPGPSERLSDAYVYAWYNEVYPTLHDSADWHKPFATSFRVNEEMVNELLDYLDDRYQKNKVPTFYELEDHYGVRTGRTPWNRMKLIHVCRYAYLNHNLDKELLKALLKPARHPTEAAGITRKFNRADHLYYH